MYPNLYYAFRDLFGIDWKFLRFINSFGFFVALSFLGAAITLSLELRRKEAEGQLHGKEERIMVGQPASLTEILVNFILGFLLGYKIIGLFVSDSSLTANPQDFIFSLEGNWPSGLLFGGIFAGLKWWEKNRQKLRVPEERIIRIWPHDKVGDLAIYAAIFGFAGAKVFHNLENWNEFVKNPLEALFSFSGLTFYGGLICAAIAIWYYARKNQIGFWQLNDAAGPGLMLAYGLGRVGCQVAGDGDWGILNSAYVSGPDGKAIAATPQQFHQVLTQNREVYLNQFGSLDQVQHLSAKAPSFLPDWLFAYSYPHNVINEGVRMADCHDNFCAYLPIPVFPTPFYETIICLGLFLILWIFRKRFRIPGTLFAFYLILNGIERFFIEKIRVNTKYEHLPFRPTQAEIISLLLVIAGGLIWFFLRRKPLETTA